MRKNVTLILMAAITLMQASCATVGPDVSSQEVTAKRAELEVKAARYRQTQLNRVKLITNRLIQFMPPETQAKLQDLQIEVSDEADINAHATFNKMVVYYGLLRFTDSDDQLATVISHELAHIAKGHLQKTVATNVLASAVGLAAGAAIDSLGAGGVGSIVSEGVSRGIAGAFSRDLEREADYFGFQYLYIAGFDLLKGAEIWERFAIEAPQSMTSHLFSTHPASPERLIRAEKILVELNAQGISPNLFRSAHISLPVPALVQNAVSLGLAAPAKMNRESKSSSSQSKGEIDSAAAAAQEELTQLREAIANLRKEQDELQKNIEQQIKIQKDQAVLEQALLEAKEASKELRNEEFGIKDIGIAKKVTNLWIAKQVEGEQRIFPLKQGGIDWFVQYKQASLNSFKALGLQHRKYRIYWYSPNKRLYSEQEFMQSQIRSEFAKTTLQWDPELGPYLLGEWQLRVFEGGKLIDERTFEVIR